jgi:hypothetical protein
VLFIHAEKIIRLAGEHPEKKQAGNKPCLFGLKKYFYRKDAETQRKAYYRYDLLGASAPLR